MGITYVCAHAHACTYAYTYIYAFTRTRVRARTRVKLVVLASWHGGSDDESTGRSGNALLARGPRRAHAYGAITLYMHAPGVAPAPPRPVLPLATLALASVA